MKVKKISKYSLITSLCCFLSLPALAVYEPIDTIIATVSNDVITQSDLDKKIAVVKENFATQGQALPDEKEIVKQVLDRLIIESLQLQMAEQAGLQVTDERLAQTMKKVAERKNMTEEEFRSALEKEGIPYDDMREQIRKDLTLQQLQQAKLRHKIQISEQEVDNYLGSAEGEKLTSSKYLMSHILLEVPEGSSDIEIQAAKKSLIDIRNNILQGRYSFNDIVNGKKIDAYNLKGNQLDWMDKASLPSLFAKTLQKLKKGDLSQPIRSGAGWHLIMLNDLSGGGSEIVHQISSRHILVKPSEVRDNEQVKKLINDLYARIEKGEDFALLAKEYSEDPGSALQGGNLGWSASSQFVKNFAQTLEGLKKGEISKPFQTEFGWHILQKLDERDHDMTLANQKNQAYQAIYERKFADELEAWLITIREEAFIEIKN